MKTRFRLMLGKSLIIATVVISGIAGFVEAAYSLPAKKAEEPANGSLISAVANEKIKSRHSSTIGLFIIGVVPFN